MAVEERVALVLGFWGSEITVVVEERVVLVLGFWGSGITVAVVVEMVETDTGVELEVVVLVGMGWVG